MLTTWQNNILIGSEKQVQIADFGLLLMDDTADYTKSGDVAYTPYWTSPDRLDGERRAREDDVYALGCLGYMVS
jgi:serine/threonine protein kinase